MKRMLSRMRAILSGSVAAALLSTPVLAAAPLTGDERGRRLGLVIGLLVVSVILIAVFVVLSGKKGGKKGK